jgi:RimJ/RimL family protein N-acetyltransferase
VIIENDTFHLRPLALADADEWLAGEDEEMVRWFEFPRRSTRDDVVRAIADWAESWRTGGPVRKWAICDLGSGAILGGVEIRRLSPDDVNLSYEVFPAWRRRGLASKAAQLALDYAATIMNVSYAVIKVLPENVASLGVVRHLGAVFVGTMPSDAGATFLVFRLALARAT